MGQPDTNVFQVRITAANTDTQVFKSPWLIGRSYITQLITITNESTTPALVKIYDDDLSSPVPPTIGNNTTNTLLEYNVAGSGTLVNGSGTIVIDRKQCPHKRFVSGMVAQSNQVPLHISVEIRED